MALSLTDVGRRRLTVGLAVATVAVAVFWWSARSERQSAPPTSDEPIAPADVSTAPSDGEPATETQTQTQTPRDCDTLAEQANAGGPDAVLLAWLCPTRPLDPITARAALWAVDSPDEAARLAPRLRDHAALYGLAQLVAQQRQDAQTPTATVLPDPARAVVSPIDATVLDHVQLAHTLIATKGIAPTQRTRARAYLAKVYLQATQQLGLGVGRSTGPFARLLAGRALHYGRSFCLAYWRNRVRGLAGLFAETEQRLREVVVALMAQPHYADGARLAVALEDARRYIASEGPRERLAKRDGKDQAAPPPTMPSAAAVVERLLHHGFVDQVIGLMIEQGRNPEGPGLAAVEQRLYDDLALAERGEYAQRVRRRFAQAQRRDPAPPEPGPGTIGAPLRKPWSSATAVAAEAERWIDSAPRREFERSYHLGRALLLIRERPDALALLVERTTEADVGPAIRAAAPWLLAQLVARDDGRRSLQQRRVAAERPASATANQAEAQRRRRFAMHLRRADRLPRGPGVHDVGS